MRDRPEAGEPTPANGGDDAIEVPGVTGPIDAAVELPGSKSYTNRALLVAALADGTSTIRRALFSDDTHYMAGALRTLGIAVDERETTGEFVVGGTGVRIPASEAQLYVGNAGTAARFLCAYLALGHGHFVLDGNTRMRERPIQPLIDGLRQLGVAIRAERENGCPPVVVDATGLRGGRVRIPGALSSQYFSALLLIAPCTPDGMIIDVEGELVSKPYVDLTASVMRAFGAEVEVSSYATFSIRGGQRYTPTAYVVEPDASGASYFFALAALHGGTIRVKHLGRGSAQGDLHVVDVFEKMGCRVTRAADYVELESPGRLRGVDVDMNGMSDVAQTVAAIAPFATAPVTIRGIEHVRNKETDRIRAVTNELRRAGARVDEHADGWTIHPSHPSQLHPATIETYDDHRMAMSFAIAGTKIPGTRIANPACVSKTFPTFFDVLNRVIAAPRPLGAGARA